MQLGTGAFSSSRVVGLFNANEGESRHSHDLVGECWFGFSFASAFMGSSFTFAIRANCLDFCFVHSACQLAKSKISHLYGFDYSAFDYRHMGKL